MVRPVEDARALKPGILHLVDRILRAYTPSVLSISVLALALAFTFNGIGIPIAATGLLHPVWAMAAMAVSVPPSSPTRCGDDPQLLIQALLSVGGRHKPDADGAAAVVEAA